MNADQIMWATIISRTLGIKPHWRRLADGSDIFVARVGWKYVALLPDGKRVTEIED